MYYTKRQSRLAGSPARLLSSPEPSGSPPRAAHAPPCIGEGGRGTSYASRLSHAILAAAAPHVPGFQTVIFMGGTRITMVWNALLAGQHQHGTSS